MLARSPIEAVEELDHAFNRGDIEAVLNFYEDDATLVIEPGRLATGKTELRRAFEVILGFRRTAKQHKTNVIESGDIALSTSRWSVSATDRDGRPMSREGFASTVFRKQADGRWLIVVDNSWGPDILV